MSSNLINIKFTMPDWESKIRSNLHGLLRFVAAQLQTQRALIFEHEGAYNGRGPWTPLKFRQGMILSKAGGRGLRGSIAPRNNGIEPASGPKTILEIGGETVTIGSSLIYANIMDKGGIIKPVRAKALKIPVPNDVVREMVHTEEKHAYVTGQKVPTRKKALKKAGILKIDGKFYIFRKKVIIPARPYLDFTPEDAQEIEVALSNRVAELMNGG